MTASPPGFGQRFGDLMKARGFWKDQRPDVARFCDEKGYRPQYVYAWLRGRIPTYENVKRLARNFDVPLAWLMLGDDVDRVVAMEARASLAGGHSSSSFSRKAARAGLILPASHRRAHRSERAIDEARVIAPAGPARLIDFGGLRAATEKVIELQAELHTFLEAFPDLVMWLDVHGTVIDCKAGAGPGLAVSPEALGRSITEVLPGAAGLALQRGLSQTLKTSTLALVDYVLSLGGEVRSYEARLLPLKQRSAPIRKVLVIARDITDRKRAEETLRHRETQYRSLVEGSAKGMCIHKDFVMQFANAAVARMFRYEDGRELVGQDIRKLLPEHKGWGPEDETVARTRGTIVPGKQRYEGRRKDGGSILVTAIMSTINWRGKSATFLTLTPRS